jgi:hypothetical protein
MAVRLDYDAKLLARVCERFATRVMQTLRRQSERARSDDESHAALGCARRRAEA